MPHTKEAWGGNRRAWGRSSFALDVIDRYKWDFLYESRDVDTNTGFWPAVKGGVTLASLGPPTADQSTSGFNSAGLPARLVNKAVTAGSTTIPNSLTFSGTVNFPTTACHYRCILTPQTHTNPASRLWRYNAPGSFTELLYLGNDTIIAAGREGVLGSGPHAIASGASLFDFTLVGTTMTIYHNGSQIYTGTGGGMQLPPGPGTLEVSEAGGDYTMHGWRFGVTFTLAEHQADADRLGL